MSITARTQAILLLTTRFSNDSQGKVQPLTAKEWGRFAEWMKSRNLSPDQLMQGRLADAFQGLEDDLITFERLESLMDRGTGLAVALEKWLRSGLWVMTRSDSDYPKLLKRRLGQDSPAVLFGCGNRRLLNGGGLAVIGSRNAGENDLTFSRELGSLAAGSGFSIVSGGARGIDEAAMSGTLEAEGSAVGVLATNLIRACSSAKYRHHLMANNLVLVSPFNPEAGFNVGNAMQRNKYIYCLANAAVAVHSGKSGGTWNGAKENLRKRWVPLWVKRTDDKEAGNQQLVESGAKWISNSIEEIDQEALFEPQEIEKAFSSDLFRNSPKSENVRDGSSEYISESQGAGNVGTKGACDNAPDDPNPTSSPSLKDLKFYDLFLEKIHVCCRANPQKPEDLATELEISKAQLNVWLKRALTEGKLKKISKPARYQWVSAKQTEMPME
jgi:predicted Rossmann fold nucleotide-binding protein DprA/Smf involved in DNA uptake